MYDQETPTTIQPNRRLSERNASSIPSAEQLVGVACVHVGRCNYVDVSQVEIVRHVPTVRVTEHATFHHNVPAFLEREGLLLPMIRAACVELLLEGQRVDDEEVSEEALGAGEHAGGGRSAGGAGVYY